jgi:hypothetical protein
MKFAYRPKTHDEPSYEEMATPLPAPAPIPPTTGEPGILDLSRLLEPTEPPRESSMMYAAPASREGTPHGGSFDGGRTKITLTREEAEMATLCGLTPLEFAHGKIRLEREKKLGMRQNG